MKIVDVDDDYVVIPVPGLLVRMIAARTKQHFWLALFRLFVKDDLIKKAQQLVESNSGPTVRDAFNQPTCTLTTTNALCDYN